MDLKEAKQVLEEAFELPPSAPVKNLVEQTDTNDFLLIESTPEGRVEVAKMVYNAAENAWQVYWMSAEGSWQLYGTCENLDAVIEEIREDPGGVFWG